MGLGGADGGMMGIVGMRAGKRWFGGERCCVRGVDGDDGDVRRISQTLRVQMGLVGRRGENGGMMGAMGG